MNVSEQARIFCLFFIIGLFIGFIFDVFRGFRKVYKMPNIVVDIQDIVFLILSGMLYFKSIIVFNNGDLRFYIVFSSIMRNCNLFFDIIRKLCYNDCSNF